MHRKSGFPTSNCSIKLPDAAGSTSDYHALDDFEPESQQKKRQQLINFGHTQWGFNNWSWCVTKQDLDFVDLSSNGKHCAGVVAFVSVTVKSLGINREDVGYATSVVQMKGSAIYQARKCSVTNALRETILSFGGNVATELFDVLERNKMENINSSKPTFTENVKTESTLHGDNNSSSNILAEARNSPDNHGDRSKIARTECGDKSNSFKTIINNTGKTSPKQCIVPAQPQQATVAVQNTVKPITKPADVSFPANQIRAISTNKPTTYPANQVPMPHVSPLISNPLPPAPAAPLTNSLSKSELAERVAEEQRAERKRKQRQLQEQFRLKQMEKQLQSNTD